MPQFEDAVKVSHMVRQEVVVPDTWQPHTLQHSNND